MQTANNKWPNFYQRPFWLSCLWFAVAFNSKAQTNLVPNPGFEQTDSCINGIGILPPGTGPTYWYSAYLTYDHLQSCLPYGAVNGLPMNRFTYQQPFEGNSCVGIHTFVELSGEQREWIMVPLLDTLIVGQTYYCSFRVNAGFGGSDMYPTIWLASSHVGMVFTTYDRHWYSSDPYPAALNFAHVLHPTILTDTVNWTLVSGSFVADSAYTYLMIGNFFSNALTDTTHFASPNSVFPWYPRGYTLIDAVCVSTSPNGCELAHGIGVESSVRPYVYPVPATEVLYLGNVGGLDLLVMDMLGRRVWSGNVEADRHELNVLSWARGAYVLHIADATGDQVVKFVLTE